LTTSQYLEIFRCRWRVVFAGVLLGVAAAGAFTLSTERVFSAEATIVVWAEPGAHAPDDLLNATEVTLQRATTYAELATSERVLAAAATNVGPETTANVLAGQVSAAALPETMYLVVTATDPSPDHAAKVANSVARALITEVARFEPSIPGARWSLIGGEIFEEATPTSEPISPRPFLNIIVGLGAGAVLGMIAAVVRNRTDRKIRWDRSIREAIDSPLLAEVRVRRSARSQEERSFANPNDLRQLRASLEKLGDGHRVTLFTGIGPRVGCTTVVCGLADAIAATGRRVLVVDADVDRPGVDRYLGLGVRDGLIEVLRNKHDWSKAVVAVRPWFDVLVAGYADANSSDIIASRRMGTLVDELRAAYDHVLIDFGHATSEPASLAGHVDGVVVLIGLGVSDRRAAAKAAISTSRILGTVATCAASRRLSKDEPPAFGIAPAEVEPSHGMSTARPQESTSDNGWPHAVGSPSKD
jgi:capsular polysaccharide biosynthesis protein